VLQAMILTDKEQMLLTPTYHVFEMYKVHHDATRLGVKLLSPEYEYGGRSMPAISLSASRSDDVVHVSIVNAHATDVVALNCELADVEASKISGRILTADELDAHNTFDEPERVKPTSFDGASLKDGKLVADIPPRSVVVLRLEE
jgi:alpha-N-arabinofuranosidase